MGYRINPFRGRRTLYTPLFEISRGGMGTVTLAVRSEGRFRRLYAVKHLHPHLQEDPAVREMFLEEARLAGLVRHPNVVGVLDCGEDSRGPYLVMDYVEGVSLDAIFQRAINRSESIPIEFVLRVGLHVARGLHAAHELTDGTGRSVGLIHRDVSPHNLLVGFDGITRITDFGIAKAMDREFRTSTGVLKGKVAYMAPEHLRFEKIDRRADLFGLGVILAELLTGKRVFKRGDNEASARAVLHEEFPDVRTMRADTPAGLAETVSHLLAKQPSQRPHDALAVARDLERCMAELSFRKGSFDAAEYLDLHFGDERDQREERIQQTLRVLLQEGGPKGKWRLGLRWFRARAVLVPAAVLGMTVGVVLGLHEGPPLADGSASASSPASPSTPAAPRRDMTPPRVNEAPSNVNPPAEPTPPPPPPVKAAPPSEATEPPQAAPPRAQRSRARRSRRSVRRRVRTATPPRETRAASERTAASPMVQTPRPASNAERLWREF